MCNNLCITIRNATSLHQFCRLLKGHDYQAPLYHRHYRLQIMAPLTNNINIDGGISSGPHLALPLIRLITGLTSVGDRAIYL